jgi:predicted phage tail protein
VFRGTAAGGEGTTAIGTVTGTSFTDTGLTNGTRYYYKVRAANTAGTSGLSGEVSAVPAATGTPPRVPFGVVITPRTGNILLQWGFMSEATGYNVYRSTTAGAETLLVHVTSPTYIDSGVTPGVTYYYQFTATNAGGESARTAEFRATAL